jgi:hypothetical protein
MLSVARSPLLLLVSNEADQSGPLSNIVTTVSSSSVLAVNKRLLHVILLSLHTYFQHPRTRYRSATHAIIPVLITGIQHGDEYENGLLLG